MIALGQAATAILTVLMLLALIAWLLGKLSGWLTFTVYFTTSALRLLIDMFIGDYGWAFWTDVVAVVVGVAGIPIYWEIVRRRAADVSRGTTGA